MKFGIIIPAYNEEKFIEKTIDSLLNQTYLPSQIIIVDDHSSDSTSEIVQEYAKQYPFVNYFKRNIVSVEGHMPGGKVIKTFNEGLVFIKDVDVICKFDADLIFPRNYLESLKKYYESDEKLGMCGGCCYIKKKEQWVLENLTNKEHLRGPIKSYRIACFEAIGGLIPAMGWDTADELLAQYKGWRVKTDFSLKVKHLRPTGGGYSKKAHYLQGRMFYTMRYGILISFLAASKLAYKKKSLRLFINYMKGYLKAKKEKTSYILSEGEGKWVRSYRLKGILKKLFFSI